MSTSLKWLVSCVVDLALGIGGLVLVLPEPVAASPGIRYGNASADPSTKGKKPNRYACERPQCTDPCDPQAPAIGRCSDGTTSWESSYACCCCNAEFNKRRFYPPK